LHELLYKRPKAEVPVAKIRYSGDSSPLPRAQETLHEISDHPVFRDASVAESTGDHVPPEHTPVGCRKASEAAAVRAVKRPLPSYSVLRLHEDLNFDLEVREALSKFAHESPDPTVPLDLLIGAVSDMVSREELIESVHRAFGREAPD
jgi:hypothetical protein